MALAIASVGQKFTAGLTATSITPTRNNSGRYLVTSDCDVYLKFGGVTATVSVFDIYLPKGSALVIIPPVGGNWSCIVAATVGVLAVQELG
jgi:hypothetical protein